MLCYIRLVKTHLVSYKSIKKHGDMFEDERSGMGKGKSG